MIKMVLYLRLIDSNREKVPGTLKSLNSLKNVPISETRLTLPTGCLSGKGVMVRLKDQKRKENA